MVQVYKDKYSKKVVILNQGKDIAIDFPSLFTPLWIGDKFQLYKGEELKFKPIPFSLLFDKDGNQISNDFQTVVDYIEKVFELEEILINKQILLDQITDNEAQQDFLKA